MSTSRTNVRSRTRRSPSGSGSRPTGLLIGVVALLVVALGLALFGGSPASDFDVDAVASPTVTGAALAQNSVGSIAPQVTAPDLFGDGTVEIAAGETPTLVVFLAHWCQYCNGEVPVVVDWLAAGDLPEGVEVRAVATAIDRTAPHYPPDTWLADRDWTVPTLVDADRSIMEAYGVPSFPYWVFLDADGEVQGTSGPLTADDLTSIAESLVTSARP